MNRIFMLAILMVGSSGAASYAVLATLSENFNSPTLNSQLYTTVGSPSYSLGPLTPGATWQLSKQAGTSVGEVAIHTGFEVFGNFTADLTVDSSNLGTGEVGIRIGQENVNPWAELFFRGLKGQVKW